MGMKLQFDAALDYQQAAIASVVGLFDGQQRKANVFTVAPQFALTRIDEIPKGIGNRLELSEADVLENLRRVQMRNGLAPAEQLTYGMDFDIEMETGTGKTYVYLRSILDLHQTYGFTKFIIVVPNLAIKEGVWKSIEITRDHFANLYDHLPYDVFVYDSAKLNEVRSFATSDIVQIMVINIDEPQSVDTTLKSKEAIASLSPLAIFRYSATHIEHHHLIYKLDAKDSYELQLLPMGIKVLSLFFIDKVANYRVYDENGAPQPGPYAKIFESCYRELIQHEK